MIGLTKYVFLFTAFFCFIGCKQLNSDGIAYVKYRYKHSDFSNRQLDFRNIEIFKNTLAWQLAIAVYEQDTGKIKEIATKDPSVGSLIGHLSDTEHGEQGFSVLEWAIINNRYYSAKTLLEAGVDPNDSSSMVTTPLLEAAAKSETSQYLILLLKHGGNPNTILYRSDDPYGTPLIAASNSFENVKILVNAGPNVNQVLGGFETALSNACYSGNLKTIEYLIINCGAEYKKPDGYTVTDSTPIYLIDVVKDIRPNNSQEEETKRRILKYMQEH